MPDNSLPQQYDHALKRQVLQAISFEDLDAYVQERLVPDGGLFGQFLKRGTGGVLEWGDTTVPNFTVGTVTTSTNINDVAFNISGVSPNLIVDVVLPVGVGATPNISVHPLINMLSPGTQGTAFFQGTPENKTLFLSLPLAPTPTFYVNSVTPGNSPFDADVTLSGAPGSSTVGFNFRMPTGIQGIPGITPNLSVNPLVNTLPVGSQGTATLSGTQTNPILTLALPLSPVPQFTATATTLAYGFPATANVSGSPANPLLTIGIPQGAPGQAPNLQIGTVNYGANPNDAQATITGTLENPLLNLTLPRGLTGLTPNLSVNPSVVPLAAGTPGQASFSGTAENPVLNLSLPLSPVPNLQIGTVFTLATGVPAAANISGTPANPLLNLSLPKGETGLTPSIAVNPLVTPLPVGTTGTATVSGTPENPIINLSLPLSPVPIFTAQATTLAPGAPATASIFGTPANPLLSIGVPKGDTGESPEFSIGQVQTLQPNQPATVWLTGTALDPVLNFALPSGLPGNGGVTINGVLYQDIVVEGAATPGGIAATTTGLPPGSVRLFGHHQVLNTANASANARPLVVNPGTSIGHVIKQISGTNGITVNDVGSELQISTQPGFGLPVDATLYDTLFYSDGVGTTLPVGWHSNSFIKTNGINFAELGTSSNGGRIIVTNFGSYINVNPPLFSGALFGLPIFLQSPLAVVPIVDPIQAAGSTIPSNAINPYITSIGGQVIRVINSYNNPAPGSFPQIGFFSVPPVPRQTAPAVANDLASCINAINSFRQSFLNYGLLQ
jgi:hypothetical protein